MLQLSGIAKTVRDEIAVGPMNLGWSRGRITAAVDNALDRLGVRHLADRAPARLSGGETQRVLLASLLATAPTSWLLDEPFSALDRRARVDVANLLAALAADGATVVVACDDADAMLPAAHRLVVFSAGRIALDGSPRQLLAGDLLPATGSGTTDAAGLAAAAGFAAPRPITVSSLLPQLIRIEPRMGIAVSEHPDFTDRTTPVLQLEGVAFRYPKGPVVLHDTSLRVSAGETVGLFGTNGAGKSTLLRLAMALEHPEAGVVHTLGLDTAGHGPEDLAPRVGFLFQQPERQLFAASVRAECRMAGLHRRLDILRIMAAPAHDHHIFDAAGVEDLFAAYKAQIAGAQEPPAHHARQVGTKGDADANAEPRRCPLSCQPPVAACQAVQRPHAQPRSVARDSDGGNTGAGSRQTGTVAAGGHRKTRHGPAGRSGRGPRHRPGR